MNFIVCTALFALIFTVYAGIDVEQDDSKVLRLPFARREELIRKLKAAGDCSINICFAIDGNEAITDEEFELEKEFVVLVSAIIGTDQSPRSEFAAVQYSTSNSPISPLTANLPIFQSKVASAEQLKGQSFVVGGINYCFSQLFRRPGDANKIVLLGDGRSNIGSSAAARADLFRQIGGEVCVVGIGFQDNEELLAIAGGDPNKVFEINDFFGLINLVDDLFSEVCG